MRPASPFPSSRRARGFTILELLVAMSMFAILGIAVVSLLGQGLNLFTSGTADTTMQDRIQAALPSIREDFAAIQPVEMPEVLPPPRPEGADVPVDPTVVVEGPKIRLIAGTFKPKDTGSDRGIESVYVGFVRSNAREAEDPILRSAGATGGAAGVPLRSYDPAAVESGVTGNLLATGGMMEVVYVAIPDDPDRIGMLTVYRLFRAPVGGPGSLLEMVAGIPVNFDSVKKIRAAGRPVLEGVVHFGVTFRNLFATSWNDGLGSGKVLDGSPYVGNVWDSTRALNPAFAMAKGKESLADVRDDVFPAMARIDLVLAVEGPYGFTRGETLLPAPMTADDRKVTIGDVGPLFRPGPADRFLKVDGEWMSVNLEGADVAENRVTVVRGRRATKAVEHKVDEPVYFGRPVSTDVMLLYKDRYARR
jgi:prepilin-type N-terminal cleavage/methylation domain-containing protein